MILFNGVKFMIIPYFIQLFLEISTLGSDLNENGFDMFINSMLY